MGLLDWIVLGLIAAAAVGAVVWMRRRRAAGKGCCGDCSRCSGCQH